MDELRLWQLWCSWRRWHLWWLTLRGRLELVRPTLGAATALVMIVSAILLFKHIGYDEQGESGQRPLRGPCMSVYVVSPNCGAVAPELTTSTLVLCQCTEP